MKVSIIIPVFNASPFLNRCISSVVDLDETGEVLLIDDRSTDDSAEICKYWANKDNRVRFFTNNGVKGAGATMNIGISNVSCNYISFLGADDYVNPYRFSNDSILFQQNPAVEAIANPIVIRSVENKDTIEINGNYKNGVRIGFSPLLTRITLKNYGSGNTFSIIGMTIKKSVFDKVGLFDEGLKQAQDTDLILRILHRCVVFSGSYDTPVAVYNRHEKNTTNNITESVFYRRRLALKQAWLAMTQYFSWRIFIAQFLKFVEYDYLWIFGKNHIYKKWIKFVFLPIFIVRFIAKYEPKYDESRVICAT